MNNINNYLDKISTQINKLKNTTNLESICKIQHDTYLDIKNTKNYLDNLKKKIDNYENIDSIIGEEEYQIISEDEYQTIIGELENIDFNSSNNNIDIEQEIDKYLEYKMKIDLCKKYLETKKLTILEIK